MERICLGLPELSPRSLQPDERDRLQRQVHRWRWSMLWITLGPLPVLGMFPWATMTSPDGLWAQRWFPPAWIAVFCLLCGGWLLCLLRGYRYFQRVRSLQTALARGEVLRFEGVITQYHLHDDTQYQLVQDGLLQLHPRTEQWVELLPESNMLYRCNGVHPPHWMKAHVAVVATPPLSTFRVPLSTAIPSARQEAPHLERRHLNSEERQELEGHIHTLKQPVWSLVGIMALLVGLGVGQIWMGTLRHTFSAWQTLVLLGVGALGLYLGRQLLQVSQEIRDMRRDLEIGWVICIPQEQRTPSIPTPTSSSPPSPINKQPSPQEERERLLEVLPISTTLWSIRGQRADWRLQAL